MRSAKCTPDCSESSVSNKNRKRAEGIGVAWNRPHCQRCTIAGRFGLTLLLCGFATGCDKMHWHGCAQQSMSDAATLLASGVALEAAKRIATAARKVVLDHVTFSIDMLNWWPFLGTCGLQLLRLQNSTQHVVLTSAC